MMKLWRVFYWLVIFGIAAGLHKLGLPLLSWQFGGMMLLVFAAVATQLWIRLSDIHEELKRLRVKTLGVKEGGMLR